MLAASPFTVVVVVVFNILLVEVLVNIIFKSEAT